MCCSEWACQLQYCQNPTNYNRTILIGGTRLRLNLESWKMRNHSKWISASFIAFWKVSESWNPAVAWGVPPMYSVDASGVYASSHSFAVVKSIIPWQETSVLCSFEEWSSQSYTCCGDQSGRDRKLGIKTERMCGESAHEHEHETNEISSSALWCSRD